MVCAYNCLNDIIPTGVSFFDPWAAQKTSLASDMRWALAHTAPWVLRRPARGASGPEGRGAAIGAHCAVVCPGTR